MDRFKHRLKGNTSENEVNVDVNSKLSILASEKMLPTSDINKVLSINERFNYERNLCKTYRLIGSIKPVASNVLMNITGPNSLSQFALTKFRDNSYPLDNDYTDNVDYTFKEAYKYKLLEKNGWFGYEDPNIGSGKLCEFFDFEPTRDKFTYLTTGETKNWEATILYPAQSASTVGDITYGGLLIIDKENVNVGGRDMVAFSTPVKHNLKAGDKVEISNQSINIDGIYEVYRVGLDNGDLKENYFCLNIEQSAITTLGVNVRMTRLVGNEPSKYYFRIFEKLKTTSNVDIDDSDYEFYRLGFSQTAFEDPAYQLSIFEDLSVEGLEDNLGRPLSEIYFSFIKKTDYIGTPFFSDIKSGLLLPNLQGITNNTTIPDIRRIHNGVTSHTPLEASVDVTGTTFYGDVVEYNRFTVKEVVLGEVYHRFNTLNREAGGSILTDNPTGGTYSHDMGVREEGYLYKPFNKIKIRDFSGYIEQGDLNTEGVPSYAEDLGDGRFLWRDFLDIGFNDIQEKPVNYPFLNNAHYIHLNISHLVQRQDPFADYNLYYSSFPPDPFGDRKDDRFKTKNNNGAC